MKFVLIMGILCIILFFCTVGIIEEILIHIYNKKHTPKVTVETPEQTYEKCCYCPHYATCTKSLEEVIKC